MQTQPLCFQMKAGDSTPAAASNNGDARIARSSESDQQPSFPLALHRETGKPAAGSDSGRPEKATENTSQLARAGESGQTFPTAFDEVEHIIALQSGGNESERTPGHLEMIAAKLEDIGGTDPEAAEGADAQPGANANPMKADLTFTGSAPGETPVVFANGDRLETAAGSGFVAAKGQSPTGRGAAPAQIALFSASTTAGNDSTAHPHPATGDTDTTWDQLKDSLRASQTDAVRNDQGSGTKSSAPDTGGLQQTPEQTASKTNNGGGETVSRMMEKPTLGGDRTVDIKEGLSAETKSVTEKGSTPSGDATDIARSSTEAMRSELLEKAPERIATDLAPRPGTAAAGDSRLSVASADLQAAADETVRAAKTNPGDIIDQIVKKAVIRFKDGISEARIDLKPELLGHLRLSISTDNQQVTLRILTENPLVKEIIESSAAQLKTDLSNQGLQMEQLEVGVNGDRDRLGHQSNNSGQAAKQMAEKTENAAADADHSTENAATSAPTSESGKEIDTFV